MKTITIDNQTVMLDDDFLGELLKRGNVLAINPKGYPYTTVKHDAISLHRLAMCGFDKLNDLYNIIDHIDGNKLNCQRSNLRFCSHSENRANSVRRTSFDMTSKYKGVGWDKLRSYYRARIMYKQKTCLIYTSQVEEDCAYAYNVAAQYLFKEFAYSNPVTIEDEMKKKQIEEWTLKMVKVKLCP